MPFVYEFYLNKSKLNGVEIGLSTSRKWEEALDEAKLSLPFYTSISPLSQYGLLEIEITQVDNFTDQTAIATETYNMLIISDLVGLVSQYGTYRHDISAIEYTGKLDAYIVASLAKTRSIESVLPAKFEITEDGQNFASSDMGSDTGTLYSVFHLPSFIPKQTYFANKTYTIEQVLQSKLILEASVGFPYAGEFISCPTVFRYSNDDLCSFWYDISDSDQDITFPSTGSYTIEYGFQATQSFYSEIDDATHIAGYYGVFRFYVSVLEENSLTMYDIVNSVRQNVSKGGGVESKVYYANTRIFDIDPTIVDYLKSLPVPQMYLEKATARQMLIFAFSYINAVPRLEYSLELDTLKIELFNLSTGEFSEEDVYTQSASQNINQIGTRSYLPLNQVLPNNMDEPTMYAPSQSGYQQVRATNLQITDASFSIKLPKEIYTPKEFVVNVPKITITGQKIGTSEPENDTYDIEDIDVSLMSRTINIEKWKLKYITDNFPSITSKTYWDSELGLRTNMVDNLYWQIGSKQINLSDVYGTLVNKTLFQNAIKLAIYEHLMLNMPDPLTFEDTRTTYMYYYNSLEIDIDFIDDDTAYKDLRFRFAYLTLENPVTKNDKEDLSQIDFYSEMRSNQDESIINVVRASRKNYGNLQRTGNKSFSFRKRHYALSEAYLIGAKDVNKFTITTINKEWFGNFFDATYFITKYHNRESRLEAVDQTYRWRDNYAKNAFNRHEHYGDYIMIYPPTYTGKASQATKIFSNTGTVKTIMSILLGETITDYKTRATVALIRTDGMFDVEPETEGNYYGILASVSAYPVAQGFAFTFGFDGNQVAGDGLVQRGTNWYNQAVRYTDESGRFTQFGFTIFSDYELDEDDYETYPKITRNSFFDLYLNDNPYFDCGVLGKNTTGTDYLVVDKDPLTDYKQTYQLNVLSYFVGLYIVGQAFYSENFIVNNPNSEQETYLFIYEDGTTYGLFEDLKIKDTYELQVALDSTKILYDSVENKVYFTGLIDLTDATSWAIGDGDGNLYIACNDNHNGFLANNEHFRVGVKEIGNKFIVPEPTNDYEVDISIAMELLMTTEYSTQENYVVQPELSISAIISEIITQKDMIKYIVQPELNINTILTERILKIENIVYTVKPELYITSSIVEGISQIENIIYMVQPEIILETVIEESISAIEYESVTVQPTITLETIITEQCLATENITNTVQPDITIVPSVSESIIQKILITNTIQPELTITSSVTNAEYKGELVWGLSNVTEYNAASTKSTIYFESTTYLLPDVLSYNLGDALRIKIYSLNTALVDDYTAASDKIDLTDSTHSITTGAQVMAILETDEPTDYATFIAGNFNNDDIIKMVSLAGTSYWIATYTIDAYYIVENSIV